MERWLPVVGYEGLYEVSDHGRVRRGGRLRSTPIGTHGYPFCTFWRANRQRGVLVHRLVLEAFVGPCPEGMEACHSNGDPSDPRLENLRWDTHRENMLDKATHGTRGRKLTEAIVDEIRAELGVAPPRGLMAAVARKHGVTHYVINRIRDGRLWRHR